MSPIFLHEARASFGPETLSARSVVQESLDAWQIVGIIIAGLLLCGLVGGGVWWERKRLAQAESEMPAAEGKGTDTTQDQELDTMDGQPRTETQTQSAIWRDYFSPSDGKDGTNDSEEPREHPRDQDSGFEDSGDGPSRQEIQEIQEKTNIAGAIGANASAPADKPAIADEPATADE